MTVARRLAAMSGAIRAPPVRSARDCPPSRASSWSSPIGPRPACSPACAPRRSAGRSFDPARAVHHRRPAAGRLPGPRGAPAHRATRARRPTNVDSGRDVHAGAGLGTLADAGIDEVRFAGATWRHGGTSGLTVAVFTGEGLDAAAMLDFYEAGAQVARRTEKLVTVGHDGRRRRPPSGSTSCAATAPARRSSPGRRRTTARSGSCSPRTSATRRSPRRPRPSPRAERRCRGVRGPVLESAAMSDRPDDWAARRRAWRVERLAPALDRLPERRDRFVTLGDLPVEGLYGPWDLAPGADPGQGDPYGHPGPGGPTAVDHHGDPLRQGAGRYADVDLGRDVGMPGRAAVHPRHPPDGLPLAPLDDAHVRGVRRRPRTRTPGSASCSTPARPACRSPTTCRRSTATTPTTPRPRASSGRAAWRCRRLADMELLLAGLPLDRVSTSMTINSPGGPDLGDVHRGGREGGRAARAPRGHDPERHPQGVRRPEGVPVPARAVDAAGRRHDRVRDARAAPLEHGLDQRLPHPRGGLDRRPGARVHDRRRDGLRGGVRSSAGCGSTTSRRGSPSSSTATATSSRRSPSSGPRAGSGGSS